MNALGCLGWERVQCRFVLASSSVGLFLFLFSFAIYHALCAL